LKTAVRKSQDRFWEALAICELPLTATKEPALDVLLAIEAFAKSSGSVFSASSLREAANGSVVTFELAGSQFETPVTPDGSTNALNVLSSANAALKAVGSPYCFHPIAYQKNHLLVAFAQNNTIERSLSEGLLPVAVA